MWPFKRKENRASLNNPSTPISAIFDDGIKANTGVSVTPDTAMQSTVVYACVSIRAETIASLPIHIYRRLKPTGKEKTTEHPLYKILHERPNPEMTAKDFFSMMQLHLDLRGNAYAEKVFNNAGQLSELWPIVPNRVKVERDKISQELKYTITLPNSGVVVFGRDKIFHHKGLMGDGVLGFSKIKMAKEAIGLSLATEEYGSRFFSNSANPSGVIEHPGKLSSINAKGNIRASFEKEHTGLSKAHRLLILEEGMKFHQIGLSQEDSQYLQCVCPGTMISMSDGSRKKVEDVNIGDMVIGWDKGQYIVARVSAKGNIPKKRLLKITTSRGRTLTASYDHPCLALKKLRTLGGRIANRIPEWIKMCDLKIGNYVKTGLGIPEIKPIQDINFQKAYLLGALIDDGYLRAGGCVFSSKDEGVSERVNNILAFMGASLKKKNGKNCDWEIITGGRGRGCKGNKFREFINESGLVGKHSHDKVIPEYIYTGGKNSWIGFLSGYFDTDGTIKSIKEKAQPALSFCSINIELLEGCQHLLSLLEIQSAIYKVHDSGKRIVCGQLCDIRALYHLNIVGFSQVQKISTLLNLAHKTKSVRLQEYNRIKNSKYTVENVLYDRIKKIEQMGEGETIGIEIEGCHTHITNGIITHNTRNFQGIEICRIFNIPPIMVGLENKSSTYASAEQFFLSFEKHTIRPELVGWEQRIKKDLFDEEDIEHFAEFSVSGLLRGDIVSRYNAYAIGKNGGWLSADDIREFENMNPLPDEQGKIYTMPLNMIPADSVLGLKQVPMMEDEEEMPKKKKKQIEKAFQNLYQDAINRIIKRERADVIRQSRKKQSKEDFGIWLDEFYDEHREFVKRNISPVIISHTEIFGGNEEEQINEFTERHINNSKKEILSLINNTNCVIETSLKQMFDDWEDKRTIEIVEKGMINV